jgi:tRNA pseudouridine55 synthase
MTMTNTESGVVVIDKPGGMTSHDVVARLRRLLGTRRVGHAGTLDPMATGVLVAGVEKATRLLGYLTLTQKTYEATIRLGAATSTDDAEGEITAITSAAGVTEDALRTAVAGLTGDIQQVPPGVSAIKINGQRAYKLTRAGAAPVLTARPVTVSSFTVGPVRRSEDFLDFDAEIVCSSGTYIRALARDLGTALGVGGHLTRLRRTRVGPYTLADAQGLDSCPEVIPLASVATDTFPRRDLTPDEARRLSHGNSLSPSPAPVSLGPVAAFAPDGTLVALLEDKAGAARPLAVFV